MLKKLLASILIFLYMLAATAVPVSAFGNLIDDPTWYDSGFFNWHNKVYDDTADDQIFGERYTAAQVRWVIFSIWAFVIGNVPYGNEVLACVEGVYFDSKASILGEAFEDTKKCLGINEFLNNTFTAYVAGPEQKSLAGLVFEERPISAITYFKDIARKVHLAPEVSAQGAQQAGFGFSALNPILELWKAMRNMTYGIFVIIVIVLAFMIMFKVKLNPQTSITIQSAIPKIIITLILVTFSYAIAGLLIDAMYLVIALISLLLSGADKIWILNAAETFSYLTKGPSIAGLPGGLGVFGFWGLYWIFFVLALFVLIITAESIAVKLVGGLGMLIAIIGILVLIWQSIKIIFLLLKTTAIIFLSTVFAPIQIAVGAVVPNAGFGPWLRNYLASLAVFPTVGLLFALAIIFVGESIRSMYANISLLSILPIADSSIILLSNQGGWPPLLGFGNSTAGLILLGTSYVIMTIIPKTVEFIQSIIKSGQFNYGAAIDEANRPITAPLGFAAGIGKEVVSKAATSWGLYGLRNVLPPSEETGKDAAIQRAGKPPRDGG